VSGLRREGHDHQARCRAVQAVHRVEALTELVAQDLEQKGLASGMGVAMHQKSGRFVHRDEVFVPVQHRDFCNLSLGHCFRSVRRAGSWACAP
jgi:hypothetical protein